VAEGSDATRRGAWWWAAAAAVVTLACGGFAVGAAVSSDDDDGADATQPGAPAEGAEPVVIRDFAFAPPDLSVAVGTTVMWTNEDSTTHTVRDSSGAVIASPNLGQGDTYTAMFTEPGTYDYICTIHTSMTGSVTVTE
jgi:plastocyanin